MQQKQSYQHDPFFCKFYAINYCGIGNNDYMLRKFYTT